jgi:hypothetical protein
VFSLIIVGLGSSVDTTPHVVSQTPNNKSIESPIRDLGV